MHFGRIKSLENASSGCKCRFIVVNRCVLNHTCKFQAAEKNVATHHGGAPAAGAPPAYATGLYLNTIMRNVTTSHILET